MLYWKTDWVALPPSLVIDCLYVGLNKYFVIDVSHANNINKGYLNFDFPVYGYPGYGHLVNLNTWYNILIEKKISKLDRKVRWKIGSVESKIIDIVNKY